VKKNVISIPADVPCVPSYQRRFGATGVPARASSGGERRTTMNAGRDPPRVRRVARGPERGGCVDTVRRAAARAFEGQGMSGVTSIAPEPALAAWNAELAFRPVVEATADKIGIEFMRQLVKTLAQALGVDFAFIAEFAGDASRVRTIAFWNRTDWAPNVEYALAGTPCEQVVAGRLCLYENDVQRLFPGDSDLARLGVRSYLGVPLRDAQGRILGHLAALDTRPMAGDPRGMAIFELFANRARAEVERLHAEAMLQHACARLEVNLDTTRRELNSARKDLDLASGELAALLEINQSAARHLRREDLFAELARSVKPLLRAERFGIEIPTAPDTLRVHVLALDQPARGPMIEEFGSAGTVCRWAQEQRTEFVGHALAELRERFPTTFAVMGREGMESLCALPLIREGRSFGALFFMSTERGAYREIPTALLKRVASAVAVAVDNCFAYEEVSALRDRLAAENVYLREEIRRGQDFEDIVGNSPAIGRVLELVEAVAPTPSTVLVLGETGTGKELVARAIHDRSPRRGHALVKVNCSAISAGLFESELFGHVRGAFTGALQARVGRFELADGGSIFLDEIGELPLDIQVKLLRVLQEREIEPVGGNRVKTVDVRVIAATNRDLEAEVAAGRFRADLYYRLNVVPIVVPPLRDRTEDIEPLAGFFAARYAREIGKRIDGYTRATLSRLQHYPWPGNVRELSNVVQRAVVLARQPLIEIGPESLPVAVKAPAAKDAPAPARAESADRTLSGVQRQHIIDVLEQTRWVVEGAQGAANLLGTSPSTLRYRMQKLGIRRPSARADSH
jgi:formate hydrogenlyase transcriptional activator